MVISWWFLGGWSPGPCGRPGRHGHRGDLSLVPRAASLTNSQHNNPMVCSNLLKRG